MPRFRMLHLAFWTAFFAVHALAALTWWTLPQAAWDRGLLALLGAALSFGLHRLLVREPPARDARCVAAVAVWAVGLGLVWTALHQSLVALTFSPDSVAGLWRYGALKMLSGSVGAAGTMLAYAALHEGLRLRAARAEPPVPLPEADVPTRLLVRSTGRQVSVPLDAVRWMEAEGDYIRLHTWDGRAHLLRETMASLAARLDPHAFVRVHRSTIVAARALREVRALGHGDAEVVLDDGTARRVGRAYRSALATWMGAA